MINEEKCCIFIKDKEKRKNDMEKQRKSNISTGDIMFEFLEIDKFGQVNEEHSIGLEGFTIGHGGGSGSFTLICC